MQIIGFVVSRVGVKKKKSVESCLSNTINATIIPVHKQQKLCTYVLDRYFVALDFVRELVYCFCAGIVTLRNNASDFEITVNFHFTNLKVS